MDTFNYVRARISEMNKEAKGRCWDGYEPVPGKEPYSPGSCQPVGGKKPKDKKKKDDKKKKAMNYYKSAFFTEVQHKVSNMSKAANIGKVKKFMADGMDMKAAIKKAYPNYTEEECKALEAKLKSQGMKSGMNYEKKANMGAILAALGVGGIGGGLAGGITGHNMGDASGYARGIEDGSKGMDKAKEAIRTLSAIFQQANKNL